VCTYAPNPWSNERWHDDDAIGVQALALQARGVLGVPAIQMTKIVTHRPFRRLEKINRHQSGDAEGLEGNGKCPFSPRRCVTGGGF
jgi:hypothetical protein